MPWFSVRIVNKIINQFFLPLTKNTFLREAVSAAAFAADATSQNESHGFREISVIILKQNLKDIIK